MASMCGDSFAGRLQPLATGSLLASLATLRDHQPPEMERLTAFQAIFEITKELTDTSLSQFLFIEKPDQSANCRSRSIFVAGRPRARS